MLGSVSSKFTFYDSIFSKVQAAGSHVLVCQVKQINKNIKARSMCRQFDVKNITLFIAFFLVNERLSLISLD